MNKKQFVKLENSLREKGYNRYNQQWHREDYILGKAFHKKDNQWEEDRAAFQIILSIYDYSNKDWPNLSVNMRDRVGIEIHIDVSRTINERIEMVMAWHDDTKIEEVEFIAEDFFRWVKAVYPKPREE